MVTGVAVAVIVVPLTEIEAFLGLHWVWGTQNQVSIPTMVRVANAGGANRGVGTSGCSNERACSAAALREIPSVNQAEAQAPWQIRVKNTSTRPPVSRM